MSGYATTPRRVEKPWGWELVWAEAETYVGKLLFVRAGQALSLQYHEVKDEAWLVQEGRASLELGAVGGELETVEIGEGDAFRYRPGTVHRVTAIEDTPDRRGLDPAPRRRRAARGPLRAEGNERAVALARRARRGGFEPRPSAELDLGPDRRRSLSIRRPVLGDESVRPRSGRLQGRAPRRRARGSSGRISLLRNPASRTRSRRSSRPPTTCRP